MVNEAILRLRTHEPVPFTVADGTSITKGALLAMTDERVAILASSAGQPLAGIAAADKVASDGQTELAVYRNGWFDMVCSGAAVLGQNVYASTTGSLNYISGGIFTSVVSGGAIILGHLLGTAADNERVLVQVNLG